MISSVKKSQLLAVTAALLLAVVPAIAQASQEAPRLTAASAGSVIQLSFKLDPRVVDSFANPGEWVGGPPYMVLPPKTPWKWWPKFSMQKGSQQKQAWNGSLPIRPW